MEELKEKGNSRAEKYFESKQYRLDKKLSESNREDLFDTHYIKLTLYYCIYQIYLLYLCSVMCYHTVKRNGHFDIQQECP